MSAFTVMPALDLRQGRVVRLRQGDFARETAYGDDPVALALRWSRAGARWLHLVDLDGARRGGCTMASQLRAIVDATGLAVQAGGGVRSEADVASRLAAGASRVVVGTVAVERPALVRGWLQRFGPEAICLALDLQSDGARGWRLPVAGWERQSGARLEDVLAAHAGSGLRHVLCTDIARDGMLAGPNLALYRDLLRSHPALAWLASGGVSSAADLQALRQAGVAGAVVGRALLEGRLPVVEALAC